jgi:hypothetical protein
MRYFIAFIVALGLLFLVIFLLLHSGGSKPKTHVSTKSLSTYSVTDAETIMTVDGPVNANQLHQQVRITVSRDNVTFEQLQGYDGDVVNQQTFSNTESAYAAFLLSLQRAGFTQGDNRPGTGDERGYCPLGDRYVFQLTQDDHDIERYWATTCPNLKTYLGVQGLTIELFQKQVPTYAALVKGVHF